MSSGNVEDLLEKAKLAEQAERYNDMVDLMKIFTKSEGGKSGLKDEERNLLSVAYKNVVGASRSSLRILQGIIKREETQDNPPNMTIIRDYEQKIKKELEEKCNEVLELIDNHLLPSITGGGEEAVQGKVFYYKMKGDYYRYLVEFAEKDSRDALSAKSSEAYNSATESAKDLASTHPIRLGLALNFSVFYYEIIGDPVKACSLAKEAFDNAIAELDSLKEDSYKDSTLIMQLLRDNLTLWTSEMGDEEETGVN